MPILLILLGVSAVAYAATRKKREEPLIYSASNGSGGGKGGAAKFPEFPGFPGDAPKFPEYPGFPGCPAPGARDAGVIGLPVPLNGIVATALKVEPPVASSPALAILAENLMACGQKKAAGEVMIRAAMLMARGF